MPEATPAFRNPNFPLQERISDLIARMTLEEKIAQMSNACPAIPRLGIPAFDYWSEALHGVARNGKATVFPQVIGMAATWDPALIRRVGGAVSDEGRAKFHAAFRKHGGNGIYQGLSFYAPNVNIFRDPRWGRGQETWGEDPYLTGEMAAAFVRGMQGDHPKYLKVAACAKHYAVHSGPEKVRHIFDAQVSRRELYDTYLPAFKKLVVDAKVEMVMGAYNCVFGEPCSASKYLLKDILRDEWGFEGHVVSDCGALTDIHTGHKKTKGGVETAALALTAGCDMGVDMVFTYHLKEALERKMVGEDDIDRALSRTLATRFKLGLFDPEPLVPFSSIPLSVVGCAEHAALAREVAAKSVVLLKNRNNLLPISEDVRSLLVVGPNAGNVNVLLGNYYGMNGSMTTFLEGVVNRAPEGMQVEFNPGCLLAQSKTNELDWSLNHARRSSVTVAFMGISPLLEGEEGEALLSDNGDRTNISLPQSQRDYLNDLVATGAKVVLVLSGGSPIALDGIEDLVDAILYVWYPGQEGGKAIADVLFGDVNPSGRLPITFPRSLDQLPSFDDYSMANRTYRYSKTEPLFPFGFGLSYTNFTYSDLALNNNSVNIGEPVVASVTVSNVGPHSGEEVVQMYLSDRQATVTVPQRKLVGFQRVALAPDERKVLELTISASHMALVCDDGSEKIEPGEFLLEIGGCSPGERGLMLGAPCSQVIDFCVSESNKVS